MLGEKRRGRSDATERDGDGDGGGGGGDRTVHQKEMLGVPQLRNSVRNRIAAAPSDESDCVLTAHHIRTYVLQQHFMLEFIANCECFCVRACMPSNRNINDFPKK